jgi:hypothetical protein
MEAGMTRSKQIIAGLQAADPSVRFGGFPAALAALTGAPRTTRQLARAVIPDGYRIDHETREVTIYEVADTNPIRPDKAEKIADLYDELEQEEWVLRVVVLDYTGHVVADVHGWAFSPEHVAAFAPPNCLDLTPAARAATALARRVREAQED